MSFYQIINYADVTTAEKEFDSEIMNDKIIEVNILKIF